MHSASLGYTALKASSELSSELNLSMHRLSLPKKADKNSAPSRQELKQQQMNGAGNTTARPGLPAKPSSRGPSGAAGKAPRKDAAGSRHKEGVGVGKEGSKPKPTGQSGQAPRPGALPGRDGAPKGWPKGSAKQPSKLKAPQGHPLGPTAGRPPKDAGQGKRDALPKVPQQRPPTVTLEPTDLFL